MNTQTTVFKADKIEARISVTQYTSDKLSGSMLSVAGDNFNITFHEVATDDLRKMAAMFSAMAERIDSTKLETANNA